MKNTKQNLLMILLLVALSAGLYGLQVTIFQTFRDTSFYFLQDLAFLPLQVAIVTIVLGRVISEWNKRERLKKINMAISAFFSEAGTEIMMKLTQLIENNDELKPCLTIDIGLTASDFSGMLKVLKKTDLRITCAGEDLESLKSLLLGKREFLLRMLENPNLLEHDTFTDMLLAVFHLTEELIARMDFACLPGSDTAHLNSDIKRATRTLLIQWLSHMAHLSTDYPYLYSLEVRRNPFSDSGGVILRD
jgi:hypothetical protein